MVWLASHVTLQLPAAPCCKPLAAGDLRSLLQLLRAGPQGDPPPCAAPLLEVSGHPAAGCSAGRCRVVSPPATLLLLLLLLLSV
jgi:hypothetical protein